MASRWCLRQRAVRIVSAEIGWHDLENAVLHSFGAARTSCPSATCPSAAAMPSRCGDAAFVRVNFLAKNHEFSFKNNEFSLKNHEDFENS